MDRNQDLLTEFDRETALTRACMERAPEERFAWKPHPRSPALGWLVGFLGILPSWAVGTLAQDALDLAPGGRRLDPAPIPTKAAALALFDTNVREARAALAAATEEQLAGEWTLLENGKVLLRMPRSAVLRFMVLNHLVHHRAQLRVYLRLCDVAVPAMYGPSADETSWT